MRILKQIFPPIPVVAFVVAIYGLLCLPKLSPDYAGDILAVSKPWGMAVSIAYGFWRVAMFHPALNEDYRGWLVTTPWNPRMPLPLGPPTLTCYDAIPLALILSFNAAASSIGILDTMMCFSAAYFLFCILVFSITGVSHVNWIVAFACGAVALTYDNAYMVAALLLAMHIVVLLGLKASLERHPQESDFDEDSKQRAWGQLEHPMGSVWKMERLSDARNKRNAGWPFSLPRLHMENCSIRPSQSVLLSLLAAWYLYVLVCLLPKYAIAEAVVSDDFYSSTVVFVCTCSAWRLIAYGWRCASPISIAGRIATGRLIVFGYDRMVVVPAMAIAAALLSYRFLSWLGVGLSMKLPVVVFLGIFVNTFFGPTLANWRLTGMHRIRRPILQKAEYTEV